MMQGSTETAEAVNRTREFIMDSNQQPADEAHMLALLGVPPISEEVAEMEANASALRISRIEHLLPLVMSYAHVLAHGEMRHTLAHMVAENPDILDRIPKEKFEENAEELQQFGFQLTMAALSQMAHLGLIQVVPKNSTPGSTESAPSKRRGLFRRG